MGKAEFMSPKAIGNRMKVSIQWIYLFPCINLTTFIFSPHRPRVFKSFAFTAKHANVNAEMKTASSVTSCLNPTNVKCCLWQPIQADLYTTIPMTSRRSLLVFYLAVMAPSEYLPTRCIKNTLPINNIFT